MSHSEGWTSHGLCGHEWNQVMDSECGLRECDGLIEEGIKIPISLEVLLCSVVFVGTSGMQGNTAGEREG